MCGVVILSMYIKLKCSPSAIKLLCVLKFGLYCVILLLWLHVLLVNFFNL